MIVDNAKIQSVRARITGSHFEKRQSTTSSSTAPENEADFEERCAHMPGMPLKSGRHAASHPTLPAVHRSGLCHSLGTRSRLYPGDQGVATLPLTKMAGVQAA